MTWQCEPNVQLPNGTNVTAFPTVTIHYCRGISLASWKFPSSERRSLTDQIRETLNSYLFRRLKSGTFIITVTIHVIYMDLSDIFGLYTCCCCLRMNLNDLFKITVNNSLYSLKINNSLLGHHFFPWKRFHIIISFIMLSNWSKSQSTGLMKK